MNFKSVHMESAVMVSYSLLPTRDSFEKILNEIPCVNSFLIFLPTIIFDFFF